MKILYEPKGPARELADLALNFATGCTKGCWYCYAPAQLRMSKKDFFSHSEPKKLVIYRLIADLEYLQDRGDERKVFMSFTHDPLLPELWPLAKEIFSWLRTFKRPFKILTKFPEKLWEINNEFGGIPGNEYGMTLTGVRDANIEPILALDELRQKTFISMEPVLDLGEIQSTLWYLKQEKYSGQIWIGRLNHSKKKPVSDVLWEDFKKDMFFDTLNIKFKQGS